mmetsp:Transcript_61650/g.180172  ORF Transcript_61650/g.180172 Transcript_61650/m.180172 type:complete len:265 (+) Transcript_61650:907-1701(+)
MAALPAVLATLGLPEPGTGPAEAGAVQRRADGGQRRQGQEGHAGGTGPEAEGLRPALLHPKLLLLLRLLLVTLARALCLALLPGLDLSLWAEVAVAALPAILAPLRLPEPGARLANPSAVQCRPSRVLRGRRHWCFRRTSQRRRVRRRPHWGWLRLRNCFACACKCRAEGGGRHCFRGCVVRLGGPGAWLLRPHTLLVHRVHGASQRRFHSCRGSTQAPFAERRRLLLLAVAELAKGAGMAVPAVTAVGAALGLPEPSARPTFP